MSILQAPNAVFPSDHWTEIPTLLPGMYADYLDAPVRGWGSQGRYRRMRGTWHFYTSDKRFSGLWARPEQMLTTGAPTAVEPNFSLAEDTPLALGLGEIYKKRWLARYWQQEGVKVLVDLFVPRRFAAANLIGVPRGWPSWATRAGERDLARVEEDYERAREHAEGRLLLHVVYGSGERLREWCLGREGCVYVDSRPVPWEPPAHE